MLHVACCMFFFWFERTFNIIYIIIYIIYKNKNVNNIEIWISILVKKNMQHATCNICQEKGEKIWRY